LRPLRNVSFFRTLPSALDFHQIYRIREKLRETRLAGFSVFVPNHRR